MHSNMQLLGSVAKVCVKPSGESGVGTRDAITIAKNPHTRFPSVNIVGRMAKVRMGRMGGENPKDRNTKSETNPKLKCKKRKPWKRIFLSPIFLSHSNSNSLTL